MTDQKPNLTQVMHSLSFKWLTMPILLGLCLVAGSNAQAQAVQDEAASEPAISAPGGGGTDGVAPGNDVLPPELQNAVPHGLQADNPVAACDFDEWIGRQADKSVKADLKALNRAVRFLPPGAPMTMDYSPDRVNFDVDAGRKNTRAWCG